jgi:transposase
MRFVGLDVHKREVEACVLDQHGKIRLRTRFPCTREALERFVMKKLAGDDGDIRVALEATTNTWGIVAVIEPLVAELVVSNPMRTRAIAEAKIKTDKVDAFVLAQLLRADFLPQVWRPDAHTMELRRLTTHRAGLVADRTRLKNRIHAILHQRLIVVPHNQLFSKAGLKWLAELELDADARAFLDTSLRLLAAVEEEIDAADQALLIGGSADPRVKLLVTLPGIDVAVAQTLLAALGDINRFKDGDHAASYLGLVPMTKQSGDHCYNGPITKQGRAHARWMLVQAAQHLAEHPGPLGVFFRRLAKKKNRNVAVVATARKLVTIAWLMIKKNEPYRYAQPRPTEAKLSRLRVAGGNRRKRGNPKGSGRHPNYGTGKRTRCVPALSEVYGKEDLPPIQPPPGEQNAIDRMKLKKYVAAISRNHRVERRSTKMGE